MAELEKLEICTMYPISREHIEYGPVDENRLFNYDEKLNTILERQI